MDKSKFRETQGGEHPERGQDGQDYGKPQGRQDYGRTQGMEERQDERSWSKRHAKSTPDKEQGWSVE